MALGYSAPYLLVATNQIEDPNFQRALVLIVEHNRDGAYGFIINRPSAMPLAAVLPPELLSDIPNNIATWFGGPVATDQGLILTNRGAYSDDAKFVVGPGIILTASEAALKDFVNYAEEFNEHVYDEDHGDNRLIADVTYPFRFVIGYAGWGPGQLDKEMRQGSWLNLPVSAKLLFDTPWMRMYDEAMGRLGLGPADLSIQEQRFVN